VNYSEKREAIKYALRPKQHIGIYSEGRHDGPDDIDKILRITETAIGAGQEMSHYPIVADAHEVWLERLLRYKGTTQAREQRRSGN